VQGCREDEGEGRWRARGKLCPQANGVGEARSLNIGRPPQHVRRARHVGASEPVQRHR
jgi:hypothetical protein